MTLLEWADRVSNRLAATGTRYFDVALALTIALLLGLAWNDRFIQDDAFISFRYAENLATGEGLVFNPGERVEGYTNPLWTLLISGAIWLGLNPVAASYLLGLTFFPVTLLFTYRLAWRIFGSESAALAAVFLLGTNYTFSSFATGGMETQLHCCLLMAGLDLLVRFVSGSRPSVGQTALLSGVLGLALLTRPDSVVLVAIALPVATWVIVRREGPLGRLAALLVPLAVITGAWLAWKIPFYGDLLPNTYYVKVGSGSSLSRGARFVLEFFRSYWILPVLAVLALAFRSRRMRAGDRLLLLPGVLAVLWIAYVAWVGGGFIEFRMLVPVLPILFVAIAGFTWRLIPNALLRTALIAFLVGGSVHHRYTFESSLVEPVRYIESWLGVRGHWVDVGRMLGDMFGPKSGVTIATTAAGAIPYYSRLESIDMHGLNDAWVARHGLLWGGTKPGHQRFATVEYLVEREVQLVVANPIVLPGTGLLPSQATVPLSLVERFMEQPNLEAIPPDAGILAMPLGPTHSLLVIYLVRHPEVQRAIAEHSWAFYQFR